MRDLRDLRDPQRIGEILRSSSRTTHYKELTLSQMIDKLDLSSVASYPQDESMAAVTAREYRAELEAREDRYAKSALESLNKTGKVEGYE